MKTNLKTSPEPLLGHNPVSPNSLIGRLVARTRILLRSSWVATGFCLAVGLLIGSLVVTATVDLLAPLVWPSLRWGAFLLVVVPTCWAFFQGVLRPFLRTLAPVQVARRIEKQIPGMNNRLVSVLDLHRNKEQRRQSPSLYRRLLQETLERLQNYQPRQVIDRLSLKRAAVISLVCLGSMGVLWAIFPYALPTALVRILVPFADIPPASDVSYVVEPGDARLLRGQDAVFAARVEEGEPDELMLELWSEGQGKPLQHPLTRGEQGRWSITLNTGNLGEGFESGFFYRVRGGGTWSQRHQIVLLDPPTIISRHTLLHFPSYLGIAEPRKNSPQSFDVSGPEGSLVEVVLQVQGQVSQGHIQLYEMTKTAGVASELVPTGKVDMEPTGENLWAGRFPLQGQGFYRAEVINELGHANKPMKEAKYTALKDNPPQVVLERPGADLSMSTPAKVPMVIAAYDDFGLDEVALVLWPGDTVVPQRQVVKKYTGPLWSETVTTNLDLAGLGLKKGTRLRYKAEVRDRKGQATLSPEYTLTITTDGTGADAQLAALEKAQDPLRAKLAQLIADQAKTNKAIEKVAAAYAPLVDRLRMDTQDGGVKPTSQMMAALQKMRGQLGDLAKQEQQNAAMAQQMAEEWNKAAQDADKMPLLPQPLVDEMKAMGGLFQQSAVQPMENLADRLAQGSNPRQGLPDLKDIKQAGDRLQNELQALQNRAKAVDNAKKETQDDAQNAMAKLRDEMLQANAALTARELDELHDFVARMSDELKRFAEEQGKLMDDTAKVPDAMLPDAQKQQAELDKEAGPLMDKAKAALAADNTKRNRQPDFPAEPYVPEAQERKVPPKEADTPDPDAAKKGNKGQGNQATGAKKDEPEEEPLFMPALGGPKPKLDERFKDKLRPVERQNGEMGEPGQREKLQEKQRGQMAELSEASAALAADAGSLEQLSKQLQQGMQQGKSQGANSPQAQGLQQLMQSKALQQAMAMAGRMQGQRGNQANGQQAKGQQPGQPSPGGKMSGAASAIRVPLDAELNKLDPAARAVLLRMQPQQREAILQGLREEGPEGYRLFIQDYFRRLTEVKGGN